MRERLLTEAGGKQPILARSKGIERKIEDERLEHKARKVLSAERKALKTKGRVIPDYTTFEYEKQLRKVATRGGELSSTVVISLLKDILQLILPQW